MTAKPPVDAQAATRLVRQLAGYLGAPRAETRAPYAARAFHRAFEAMAPRGPVACRAGCNYCCHQVVSARAAEIFLLARAIAALPEDRRQALTGRIRAAAAATAGMAVAERHRRNLPCPVLEDGRCALYAERPLACRAFASTDAEACARAFAHEPVAIPVPRAAMELRGVLTRAGEAAARIAGLPDGQYELIAALAIALDDPEAERKWLAGADVLAAADARRLVAGTVSPR
ncbi:YkgJ family cysteine cluster protein [Stella sp.]|uniref:YkgJ family cysteine cluster protein n=1 Tax=Stella sp. TaxID=2912054 RepID=UPI0035B37544